MRVSELLNLPKMTGHTKTYTGFPPSKKWTNNGRPNQDNSWAFKYFNYKGISEGKTWGWSISQYYEEISRDKCNELINWEG